MKIAIAQIQPARGNIERNIALHRAAIALAVAKGAKAVFFSELSITAYEPALAGRLKVELEDERFEVFQQLSNSGNVIIGIGAPVVFGAGVQIAMILFQPHQARRKYAKQILHEDEAPYFVSGHHQLIIQADELKLAPAICYESLQPQHISGAIQKGANVYLASVAKSRAGIEKANAYFPNVAQEKAIPILMVNATGACDNFECAGQSAVWNKEGRRIGQLEEKKEGILVYDTITAGIERLELYP